MPLADSVPKLQEACFVVIGVAIVSLRIGSAILARGSWPLTRAPDPAALEARVRKVPADLGSFFVLMISLAIVGSSKSPVGWLFGAATSIITVVTALRYSAGIRRALSDHARAGQSETGAT